MATKQPTATASPEAPTALPGAFAGLTVSDAQEVPKQKRGRTKKGPVPEVVFCRNALEDSIKNHRVKTFEGVDEDKREMFARYIRQAGLLNGNEDKSFSHNGPIKVETRYNKNTKVLYFGETSIVRELAKKTEQVAQAS